MWMGYWFRGGNQEETPPPEHKVILNKLSRRKLKMGFR